MSFPNLPSLGTTSPAPPETPRLESLTAALKTQQKILNEATSNFNELQSKLSTFIEKHAAKVRAEQQQQLKAAEAKTDVHALDSVNHSPGRPVTGKGGSSPLSEASSKCISYS